MNDKRTVLNRDRQTVLGLPHLVVLAQFGPARLPANSMTRAMSACMSTCPRRNADALEVASLSARQPLHLCGRNGSAWLPFVRVNDGVDSSQRGTIQLGTVRFRTVSVV